MDGHFDESRVWPRGTEKDDGKPKPDGTPEILDAHRRYGLGLIARHQFSSEDCTLDQSILAGNPAALYAG